MSVLVECWSLVIPRRVVDAAHPGGVRAYLEVARDGRWGARWSCADDGLTSVSFASRADATRLAGVLESLGVAAGDDVAFVDERDGPDAPRPWLAWRRHDDGYGVCWLAGTAPGALCAPEGWEAPRAGGRGELPDRMRLASDAGHEVWLDFATGRLTTIERDDAAGGEDAMADGERRAGDAGDGPAPGEARIMPVLRRALDEREWEYAALEDAGAIVCSVAAARTTYRIVAVADERYEQLAVYVVLPTRVPAPRRQAAGEFVARANYGLRLGNFELGFDDGEVRFKVSVDVEGSELTPVMVHTMLAAGIGTVERYHDALLAVVFGEADPAAAVREAEGR
jgi:hypothetical protein